MQSPTVAATGLTELSNCAWHVDAPMAESRDGNCELSVDAGSTIAAALGLGSSGPEDAVTELSSCCCEDNGSVAEALCYRQRLQSVSSAGKELSSLYVLLV